MSGWERKSKPAASSSANPNPNPSPPSRLDPEATPFVVPPTTTASMYVNASKTVLLQTARAIVYNPQGPQSTLEV